ncbi:uncharacterized protein TRUGW13939_00521 [Talaromyces rugulosus]|uniref:HNH nuclease domain-containing protein n=1 Tax=Talaromyces rugulosus TaxID=121627 RepID=A0A7H8QIH4_TALRU|nr:uncharacterized protein TRUGW13939_00521 [Talaromyces rugulosus]QKX53442.1 hypothetical protein TRUGW13939_00521 [Talaromyces rugulosus]
MVLTKIENPIVMEHAHIYPFSLGIAGQRQSFWDGLRLFWLEEVVDIWHEILGTAQGTERLVNTMMLDCTSHRAWGAALFAFKFEKISEDKRQMNLKFYWLPRRTMEPQMTLSKEEFLKSPEIPSERSLGPGFLQFFTVRTGQTIKSGDIITLYTLGSNH